MTIDDEFDPLAPVVGPEIDEPEPPDDDPLAAPAYEGGAAPVEEEDEFADDDGGFSDHEKVVRVWIEDGRLTKVRLSPVWFHKVPDGKALEARFRQALLLSSMRIAEDPDGGAPGKPEPTLPTEVAGRFRGLPELSRRSLVAFDRLGAEMDRRHAAALDAYEAPAPPAPTTGRSKGVTVTLNPAGLAVRVEFEPKWLDDAQVGSICTHVMIAAERAYARHRPVEQGESVLDEVAAETALYRRALRTMLTPRGARD